MWNYIISLSENTLWQTVNSGIVTTILGIIIGSWVTLKIVEGRKKKTKKEVLLNILYRELISYSKPSNTITYNSFQLPQRSTLVWNLLTTDVLDVKKDKELIISLYELIGYIENFNVANSFANQALLENNKDMLSFFSNGRDELYHGSYIEKEKLMKLLKEKYRIN